MLSHELERGRRERAVVSFVLLDLDHFKLVNDQQSGARAAAVSGGSAFQ